jgi:hypothetical protein
MPPARGRLAAEFSPNRPASDKSLTNWIFFLIDSVNKSRITATKQRHISGKQRAFAGLSAANLPHYLIRRRAVWR